MQHQLLFTLNTVFFLGVLVFSFPPSFPFQRSTSLVSYPSTPLSTDSHHLTPDVRRLLSEMTLRSTREIVETGMGEEARDPLRV